MPCPKFPYVEISYKQVLLVLQVCTGTHIPTSITRTGIQTRTTRTSTAKCNSIFYLILNQCASTFLPTSTRTSTKEMLCMARWPNFWRMPFSYILLTHPHHSTPPFRARAIFQS